MYKGKENYETVKHLMEGEECIVTGYGQSMTPILKSGQSVRCIPVTEKTGLKTICRIQKITKKHPQKNLCGHCYIMLLFSMMVYRPSVQDQKHVLTSRQD